MHDIAEEFGVEISSPSNGMYCLEKGAMRIEATILPNTAGSGDQKNNKIEAALFELDDQSQPWLVCRYTAANLRYAVLFGLAIFSKKGLVADPGGSGEQWWSVVSSEMESSA